MREKIVRRAACEFKDGMWVWGKLENFFAVYSKRVVWKMTQVCQPWDWNADVGVQLHPPHYDRSPAVGKWDPRSWPFPHTWPGKNLRLILSGKIGWMIKLSLNVQSKGWPRPDQRGQADSDSHPRQLFLLERGEFCHDQGWSRWPYHLGSNAGAKTFSCLWTFLNFFWIKNLT